MYGAGTESIVDREQEIRTMQPLSRHDIGAKLYALFTNGIVYEFIPGCTLSVQTCKQPEVFSLAAAKIGRLHSLPLNEAFAGSNIKPLIWDLVDKFIGLASECFARDPSLEVDFRAFREALEWVKRDDAAELCTLCEAQRPSSSPTTICC